LVVGGGISTYKKVQGKIEAVEEEQD